jgi:hypothetical protein
MADTEYTREDAMNTPLPCDVKVGHTTFRKGVALGTFVEAARRWHREAFPEGYALTDEQKAQNLARLQGVTPERLREAGEKAMRAMRERYPDPVVSAADVDASPTAKPKQE